MAQRYKINGTVTIPAGLYKPEAFEIDSPEFEVVSGRLADYTTYTIVRFYYNQGNVPRTIDIELSKSFAELTQEQLNAVTQLIGAGEANMLTQDWLAGASPV